MVDTIISISAVAFTNFTVNIYLPTITKWARVSIINSASESSQKSSFSTHNYNYSGYWLIPTKFSSTEIIMELILASHAYRIVSYNTEKIPSL